MKKGIVNIILICAFAINVQAQQTDTLSLDLKTVVNMANSKSLSAFRSKNMYLADYWQYRTYKANRLPSLALNMTPVRYNKDFLQRYDSEKNINVYRQQQSFYSYGNLALTQNFDWLGGTFYVDTELGFLRNFGAQTYKQYTSVPFRIGYRQNLLGYNAFKWEKQIAPLKYQAAKQELIYNMEQTSEQAVSYFFNLAMAQAEYKLARENRISSDTLYSIGSERFKIAGIRQTDLLTLKLDKVNAKNSLRNAEIKVKRSMFALASFLDLPKDKPLQIILPDFPKVLAIASKKALEYAQKNHPKYLQNRFKILQLEQQLDKVKRESRFNLGLSASVGFNQVAENFRDAYRSPLQQDVVMLKLAVPILDWGVGKGKRNVATSNLKVSQLTARQEETKLEEDVIMTIGDFSVQQDLIYSAKEALELAKLAYSQTKERFITGKVDLNSLTLANNRHQQAQQNFISALRNYWLSYYKIRRLTLFDFEQKMPITLPFNTIK